MGLRDRLNRIEGRANQTMSGIEKAVTNASDAFIGTLESARDGITFEFTFGKFKVPLGFRMILDEEKD